jgi:redox-sensitive bicupin YhaK (pirin superfamily)
LDDSRARIAHSEPRRPELRKAGSRLFRIQSWVALSRDDEETSPDFIHYDDKDLPMLNGEGKTIQIIAGSIL